MSDVLDRLDLLARRRIETIAKELSAYGLGISLPHMHDYRGKQTRLPIHLVALEQDCRVSFIERNQCPEEADTVGWRWVGDELIAFARCCGNQPD